MSEENRAVTQVGPSLAPKLQVTRGENAGEEFKVKMRTRLGRERDNDIILLDLKSSRHHAEIEVQDGQWVLTDLDSANGTLLNGAAIKSPTPIKHGDVITVGETDLVFKIPGKPDPVVVPSSSLGPPQPVEVPRRGEASGAFAAVTRPPQPAPAGNNRLVWIVGGVLIILCLIAAIIVFFSVGSFTNSSTTTNDDEPATPAASPAAGSAKPPLQGNQAVDAPGRPTDLTLVYEEDFSDSFSGWDDAFDAYTRKVYGNNRYNIEVFASNLVAWGLANRIVSDFEIEVEGKLEDGDETNSYGLLFRFTDRENFYRFDISGDGYYLVSKFVNGEWITLVDWTASEFINTGLGATNILKVTAFGPNLTLSVNGQQLATVTDDSLTRGNFGFFSGTFAEPYAWVSFDNLKMWTRPEEEIVLIPTATPLGSGAAAQALTPTATPVPATATPALQQAGETISPATTPTVAASPTPLPTATTAPLPEYASREQTLARGEQIASGRIVFPVYDTIRGTYDIYMADIADGDNLLLIQKNASQPSLTSNGKEIAYRSWQPDKRGLFARPLAGDPTVAWGFDLFFESARPQYAPDDQTLLYFSRTGGKEPAIYQVVDGIGEVKRRDGAPIQGKAAKWSPDGSQFVYNGCLGSQCGVILSNIDGGAPVLLTDQPADTNPEISPDGKTVVFMSNRAGNWEIYSINLTGENLQALAADTASDGLPTWSPDGSKIAFVSNRDGEWAVWVMNADGTNLRRQFVIDGELDGTVQTDIGNSFGWTEENIDWVP